MSARRCSLWFLVYEIPESGGTWTAHCPELNVVCPGESPLDAFDACADIVGACLLTDLSNGIDSFAERKPAGDDVFERLRQIKVNGRKLPIGEIPPRGEFAIHVEVVGK